MTETPQEAGGSKDGGRLSRPVAAVGGDLRLGYDAGVTGLSAMVAFNLLFAIFSVALLALFVWGRLLESQALEASALEDLRGLFPAASESTLTGTLSHLRSSSVTLGVVGGLGALWASASFWGARDTALSRIYPLPGRNWLAQKRLALLLIFATLALVATTVALPTSSERRGSRRRAAAFRTLARVPADVRRLASRRASSSVYPARARVLAGA